MKSTFDDEVMVCIILNPLVANGLSHPYHFDETTFILRGIRSSFFFVFFLAHLSRRLIGELIGYSWSVVRPFVVRPSTMLKHLLHKTAWPIKAKFYVEPPWVGGTKVCSRHLGHMTKMTAMPIYVSKIFSSRTGGPIFTKLGM